ncbi:MAG: hypothetical protein KBT11_06080 [Treponema sp.]|nr:hypothetical protein [Candidatus Treponema equifaecale]
MSFSRKIVLILISVLFFSCEMDSDFVFKNGEGSMLAEKTPVEPSEEKTDQEKSEESDEFQSDSEPGAESGNDAEMDDTQQNVEAGTEPETKSDSDDKSEIEPDSNISSEDVLNDSKSEVEEVKPEPEPEIEEVKPEPEVDVVPPDPETEDEEVKQDSEPDAEVVQPEQEPEILPDEPVSENIPKDEEDASGGSVEDSESGLVGETEKDSEGDSENSSNENAETDEDEAKSEDSEFDEGDQKTENPETDEGEQRTESSETDEEKQKTEDSVQEDNKSDDVDGEQAEEDVSEPVQEEVYVKKDWTILVYMSADNDLESSAIADFNEMERAAIPDNVAVLVLLDRSDSYDASNGNWSGTRLYKVSSEEGSGTSLITSRRLQCKELELTDYSETELDMGNKDTLSKFIRYARNEWEAEHYGLIMWGHGAGWRSEKEKFNLKTNELNFKSFSIDDGNSSSMTLRQLRLGIEGGMDGEKLDFIGFDTCFGVTLEVAYELSDCAELMAGTPALVPEAGWNYTKLFDYFSNSDFSLTELGTAVQKQFCESYDSYAYGCFCQINLSKVPDLVSAFDTYSRNLAEKISTKENKNTVFEVFQKKTISYYSSAYPTDFYVDLHSLITELEPLELESGETVMELLEQTVVDGWSASGDFCGPGLFFVVLTQKGRLDFSHPNEYVNGTRNSGICKFVSNCSGYVPTDSCKGSLLDKLFYTYY